MVGWRQPSKLILNERLQGSSASGGSVLSLDCSERRQRCAFPVLKPRGNVFLCPAFRKTDEGFDQPAGANRLPLGRLWSSATGRGIQDLRPSEDELHRSEQKTNCSAFMVWSLRQSPCPVGQARALQGAASPGAPLAAPEPSAGAAGAARGRSAVRLSGNSRRKVGTPPLSGTGCLGPGRPLGAAGGALGPLCRGGSAARLRLSIAAGAGAGAAPAISGRAAPLHTWPGPSTLSTSPPSAAPRAWLSRDASAPLPACSAMSSAAARVGSAPRSLLRASLRSPSAGGATRRSGVLSAGALRNYFLH